VDAGTLGPTTIMDRVRLDAHVHVGHNAFIESDTLVAAQAGFAGSVHVGRGVLVGGQAGFADHVTVGDGARVAAQSGVIGHVPAGTEVAGFPAVPKVRLLRALALLFRRKTPGRQP
jgi:UDP-3-O-[3-hydroxymyristoyl] glucosamine N-acyltransferase